MVNSTTVTLAQSQSSLSGFIARASALTSLLLPIKSFSSPFSNWRPSDLCKIEVGSCCCPGLNSLWCLTSLIVMAKFLSLSPYSGLEDTSAVLPPPIYIHHIHTHFPSVFLRVLLLAVSSQSLCASYTGFCAIYQPTSHAPVLGPLHLLFLLPRMLSSHLPTWLIPSPPSDVIP